MRRSLVLPLALLFVLACEGSEGPMGPEGPEGPPGSANVVSGSFTVAPDAWVNDFWYFVVHGGTQGNPAKVATVAVPALTADIINNGAVFVYLRVPDNHGVANHWAPMPFHQGGFAGGYLVSIKSAVRMGQVRVGYLHEMTDQDLMPPPVYDATLPPYEFRYVAIAGVAPSALAAYARLGDPDLVLAAFRGEGRY